MSFKRRFHLLCSGLTDSNYRELTELYSKYKDSGNFLVGIICCIINILLALPVSCIIENFEFHIVLRINKAEISRLCVCAKSYWWKFTRGWLPPRLVGFTDMKSRMLSMISFVRQQKSVGLLLGANNWILVILFRKIWLERPFYDLLFWNLRNFGPSSSELSTRCIYGIFSRFNWDWRIKMLFLFSSRLWDFGISMQSIYEARTGF